MAWDAVFAESGPRAHHGVTVVGVKRAGEEHAYDQLIVAEPTVAAEKFCSLR
jgi:trk system potassium uptake protein